MKTPVAIIDTSPLVNGDVIVWCLLGFMKTPVATIVSNGDVIVWV